MTFRVRIDPVAQRHIDEFAVYLCQYSEEFAIEQIDRLNRIISSNLGQSPLTWAHFCLHGRTLSRLSVSRRAPHAILDFYTVDEEIRTVDILHFWNASRDPDALDL
jgi:plasmid stabilization system protein ParE